MKFAKRITALALGAALAVSLAACGGGTSGGGAAPSPADAVKAAGEKMNAAKSLDAVMSMEMSMAADGQSVDMTTTMDMSCFSDPLKLRVDMNLDMGALGAVDMTVYAQGEGENYTMYLFDGTSWTAQNVAATALEQYDAQGNMDLYLDSASDFTAAGTEDLTGGTADKYTGVIRGDAMEEVLKASGAMSSLESTLGSDAGALTDLYTDLGDLPVTIWVDQATGYPVRFTMDMTDIMGKILEKMATALGAEDSMKGLTVSKMIVHMDCSNFDTATDFTIPEEALAAG